MRERLSTNYLQSNPYNIAAPMKMNLIAQACVDLPHTSRVEKNCAGSPRVTLECGAASTVDDTIEQ